MMKQYMTKESDLKLNYIMEFLDLIIIQFHERFMVFNSIKDCTALNPNYFLNATSIKKIKP